MSVFAQMGTATLSGVVNDASGFVVADVEVTATRIETGAVATTKTNAAGVYFFTGLMPGHYHLHVFKQGFKEIAVKEFLLHVQDKSEQNFTLEIGSVSESVTVQGQASLVNSTDAALGIAFTETQVTQLPLEAGNVPDLLSLQAGVAYTGNRPDIDREKDTRGGAVNGARSDQSNITLDGVDVNGDIEGIAFQAVVPITQDSVQEFRVTTSNFNADQGRSSGAQVSLLTKSGTNNFHGTFFESQRNTITSANDFLVKRSELASGLPNKPPTLLRNNFGAALGGPIKKNRLFFFANYEGHRQREEQSVLRIVPSPALQDGVISYQCQDPTACSDGSMVVQGLTSPHTIQAGYYALSPAQIQAMDPQGIGVSSNVIIPYLRTFAPFSPNDVTTGDGVNFMGYRFRGPVSIDTNWYIARADYKVDNNGHHNIFWRGALRNDFNDGVPYLPGGSPLLKTMDYSKGYAVGYDATLRPTLVNNFRYGYTRASVGTIGTQTPDPMYFVHLNDNSTPDNSSLAVTYNSNYQAPVHNFVDDLFWVRGKHVLQFGGNITLLRNPETYSSNSYFYANDNIAEMNSPTLANSGAPGHFDPACSVTAGPCSGPAYPQVAFSWGSNYDFPLAALTGIVSQVTAVYNQTPSGASIPDGTPLSRRFAEDSYEMYVQDSWKVRPNLQLTFGLRYSLFSPPWETNGNQVGTNVRLGNWFNQRWKGANNGIGSNAAGLISFDLSGPANHGPGFYDWDKKDFAPRLALAWSPSGSEGLWKKLLGASGQTSIRAGASIVYDRLGPDLISTFDQNGSFGLSSILPNPPAVLSPATAPRVTGLTGLNNIPTKDINGNTFVPPEPPGTWPKTFPVGAFLTYFGLDENIRTPYSYTMDLSLARDIDRNLSLQVAYVGRLAHRLLSQSDLAAPIDLVDPKTKIDYYAANRALAVLYKQTNADGSPKYTWNTITPALVGPTAQYWYDMIQPLPAQQQGQAAPSYGLFGTGAGTTDALQAAYQLFSVFNNFETNATLALDQGWGLADPNTDAPYYSVDGPYSFWSPQFNSLMAWRSIGTSSYNALQVNLHQRTSHGVQFDLNYTYSRSIDLTSEAASVGTQYSVSGIGGTGGQGILNPYTPKATRAVSDFDLTQQINANFMLDLPFGKSKWLASNAHGVLQGTIGGWQLSGLARWTSGFPISVSNGAQWPTNWALNGYATKIGPVQTRGAVINPDGSVNIFGNSAAASAALINGFRGDFPGEVGTRNCLRGDGFAGLDLGLSKRWVMPWKESQDLQFRWDVFNAPNLTRFDVASLSLSLTNASNFGNYTGLLTNPRSMQFQLKYSF
jgi:hypothetical protein